MTREEARLTLQENLGMLSFMFSRRISEAIKVALEVLSQPSFHSNIEEAAEEYADYNSQRWHEDGDVYYDHSKIMDAFKAGAKWMAQQGETVEGYITDEIAYNGIAVILDNEEQFKPGDKVIVQIRKKEE